MVNCEKNKPSVLLHICCAPDSTAVVERLRSRYNVTGYFHNPNIFPPEEYEKRSREAVKAADKMGFALIVPPYNPDEWNEAVKGLEKEPEKGRRCRACFRFNLRRTARKAHDMSFPYFTTTLTISPHKNADLIMDIGHEAAAEYRVHFLAMDFKKRDGFLRSLELSKKFHLYRQNYCGCRYSMRSK